MKLSETKISALIALVILVIVFLLAKNNILKVRIPEEVQQKKEVINPSPTKEETLTWLQSQTKNMGYTISFEMEGDTLYHVGYFKEHQTMCLLKLDLSQIKEVELDCNKEACSFNVKSYFGDCFFLSGMIRCDTVPIIKDVNSIKEFLKKDKSPYTHSSTPILIGDRYNTVELRSRWHKAFVHLVKLCGGCNPKKTNSEIF